MMFQSTYEIRVIFLLKWYFKSKQKKKKSSNKKNIVVCEFLDSFIVKLFRGRLKKKKLISSPFLPST